MSCAARRPLTLLVKPPPGGPTTAVAVKAELTRVIGASSLQGYGGPVQLQMIGSRGPAVRCPDGSWRLQADCPPPGPGQVVASIWDCPKPAATAVRPSAAGWFRADLAVYSEPTTRGKLHAAGWQVSSNLQQQAPSAPSAPPAPPRPVRARGGGDGAALVLGGLGAALLLRRLFG